MTIDVLVVDDEALARKRIRRLLSEEKDVRVVGECADGREAIEAIRKNAPDLVFLDVQMPELDGFGVLEALAAEQMPVLIFVTAYDQYALRAFEYHALDYLLKPFDAERFRTAFRRARALLAREQPPQQDRLVALLEQITSEQKQLEKLVERAAGRYLDRLMVKTGGRVFFVKVSEIDWLEAAGNYIRLHVGRDSHLVRETMTSIETKLDPARFVRIHRSTIVNLDRVKEMQPWFSGEYMVILYTGEQLKLSRGYRDVLEARMSRTP
jgi:two-component system, LytTR family, response regulator